MVAWLGQAWLMSKAASSSATSPVPIMKTVSRPEPHSTPDSRPAIGTLRHWLAVKPPNPPPASAPSANDSGASRYAHRHPRQFRSRCRRGRLRMTGKYGGGRLLLDFTGNSLVLDCGQAHIRQPYTVENTSNAFLIHVQNPVGPFTLLCSRIILCAALAAPPSTDDWSQE